MELSELERIQEIKRGSGGAIYKVIHRRSTGKLYALKSSSTTIRRQIISEILILYDADHPNLVRSRHVFYNHDGEIQVLLDYVNGGSLKGAHISDEATQVDLCCQILSGIVYLHNHQIFHRYIKPSNLLLNSLKSPDRINMDLAVGEYEWYAGNIWSFGLSVLEIYLCRYPIVIEREGETNDLYNMIYGICIAAPPEAPLSASLEFRDFIACCLLKDPTKRWSAEQLLRHPFVMLAQLNNQSGNVLKNKGEGKQRKGERSVISRNYSALRF